MNKIKLELYRFLLLLLGGAIGTSLAVAYAFFYNWGNDLPNDSFKQMAFIFNLNIILIMSLYNTGITGSKILKINELEDEINQSKKWHSYVLNSLFILILIVSSLFD